MHLSSLCIDLSSFLMFQNSLLCYISLKNFWPVFKGRFASNTFFSFLSFENVFISFLLLQDNFAIYRICSLQLFLSVLKKYSPFGLQNFR